MKRALFLALVFLSLNFGPDVSAQNPIWTNGTAKTIAYRNVEISLLRPARLAVGRKSELAMHPIGTFALPHLFFKHEWFTFKFRKHTYLFSSRHGLYYPTVAERFAAKRPGLFKLFRPEDVFNHALGFQNEILISRWLKPPSQCYPGNNLLTLKLGAKYSFGLEKPYSPAAPQVILYRETKVFEPKLVSYIGLGIDAHLNSTFNWFADLDFYNTGQFLEDFNIEAKAGIMGYSGRHWSALVGAKGGFASLGGDNRLFVFPVADIAYTFKRKGKRKKEMGLFGNEVFKYQDTSEEGDDNIRYRGEDSKPDEPGSKPEKNKWRWLPWK